MEAIEASATLRFYRISPFKTRLVADMVRGRRVDDAMKILAFTRKRGAEILLKLLKSAVANAEEKKVEDTSLLEIASVWVNRGPSLRRHMPRARGRADTIRRPTSHVTIVVREDLKAKAEELTRRDEADARKAKKRAAKKEAEKGGTEKKPEAPAKAASGEANPASAAGKPKKASAKKKKES